MPTNVLTARDNNARVKSAQSSSPGQSPQKSLEYHRKVLHSRVANEEANKYSSPSDEIQSPASRKLQAFKSKYALKGVKPQTLFKKTSTKNLESAKGSVVFADIPKKSDIAETEKV